MNLYIFEPYEWAYCGGAIGVVARTFNEAVKTIIESDNNGIYKYKYFRTNIETFEEDESNQWLLTHKMPLSKDLNKYIEPQVLFNNWNDA